MRENSGIWNEKVNADFEGSRKEFWAFVGRRTKGTHSASVRHLCCVCDHAILLHTHIGV